MANAYLSTVDELHNMVRRNIQSPEMYSMKRDLQWGLYGADSTPASEVRPVHNMEDISEEDPATWTSYESYPLLAALEHLNQYYSYARGTAGGYSKDARENSPGMFDEKNIHSTIVWLDRQWAFAIQLQHAFLDVTRTHQEMFFNRQHHQALWDAEEGLKSVSDFIINRS